MKIPYKFKYIENFKPVFCINITDMNCINLFFKNNKINIQKISKVSKNEYCNYLIHNYLKYRFNDSKSLNETLYRIYKNIEIRPVCKGCGKPATYMAAGIFQRYCSVKCAMNSEEVKQYCKDCLQEKYGVNNVYQLEDVKKKIRQTNLQRLGVEMPIQNKDIKEKSKRTCLEKYGVENISQSDY